MYAAANAHPRQHRQGHAVEQGGRRPRAAPRRGGRRPEPSSRRTPPGSTSPTRWSASCPASSATPPGGWPEPFRTRALAGRAARPGVAELSADDVGRVANRPRRDAQQAALPRPDEGLPGVTRVVQRPVGAADAKLPVRAASRERSTSVEIEEGKTLFDRARSDRRARRARDPHRDVHDQRAAPPVPVRDRSVAAGVPAQEKADPSDPGHVAAPFDGTRDASVAEGDTRGGRLDRGHDRGDEDGGCRSPRRSPVPSSGSRSTAPAGRGRRSDPGGQTRVRRV